MEVHHHPHTPRKKWTHYFWEFLMLFLAVFCGFLAENQREHIVEQKRENKYIQSMIEDLKSDTVYFNELLRYNKMAVENFDSVVILLGQKRNEFYQQRLYFLIRIAFFNSDFARINDRTYDQMKSSGNLRLLHKQLIADSISRYYFVLKELDFLGVMLASRLQSLLEIEGKIFEGNVFQQMTNKETFEFSLPLGNPPLLTEDKKEINEFIVRLHYVMSTLIYSNNITKTLKAQSSQLIQFLKKEYHLK